VASSGRHIILDFYEALPKGVLMWVCPICQSKERQVICCSQQRLIRNGGRIDIEVDRSICEKSLHRTPSLTAHLRHMEKEHGWKVGREE
jgi:hypothetical protein